MLEEKVMKILSKHKCIGKKLTSHELTIQQAELEIKELVNAIEKEIQESTFESLIEPTTSNTILCDCHETAFYKSQDTKQLYTGRSKIKIKRRRYYCPSCGKNSYPLDQVYGIENTTRLSPYLTSCTAYLSSHLSYQQSSNMLRELLNINISATSVQNQSEKLGQEVFDRKFSYIPSESQDQCDKMVIMADGGMIHTGKDEYRETRVGVVIKFFANKGFKVYKLAICESASDFIKDFDRFCHAHGSLSCQEIVIVGDGASWLDTLKSDCFPNAERIIDYYHAKEYLINALKELYGRHWQEKEKSNYLLGLLENGECLQIANEFKDSSDKQSSVFKAKRYYQNHYEKMRYKDFEGKGYPIGSGEVEGAVRHVVHDRMGKSRSTWSISDANAILILRAYIISGYWENIKQKRYQKIWKT